MGIEKILLATDYPYEDSKECMQFLQGLPITQEAKDKIYCNRSPGNKETGFFRQRKTLRPQKMLVFGIPLLVEHQKTRFLIYSLNAYNLLSKRKPDRYYRQSVAKHRKRSPL